ncbi:MAG TPA: hypothetical protein VD926_14245, partial [Acidimicrobiales bacterium]|nr:hypothetical protein [Acidimicrobiales bacterium]
EYVDAFIRGWTDPNPIKARAFWQEEFARIVPVGPNGLPSEIGLNAWESLMAEVQKRMPMGYQPPPMPEMQVQPAGMAPPAEVTAPDYTALLSQVPPEVLLAYANGLQQPAPQQAQMGVIQ